MCLALWLICMYLYSYIYYNIIKNLGSDIVTEEIDSLNRDIDLCVNELCRMFVVLGTSLPSSIGSYEDILQHEHFNTKERVLKENIIRNSLLNFSEKSCILEVLYEIIDY